MGNNIMGDVATIPLLCLGLFQDDGQPLQEGPAVFVVSEKLPPFNSAVHDVFEDAGSV